MRCDHCGEDKTVTITTEIQLTRIKRSGRETVETVERRQTRLCRPCGGSLGEVLG